MNDPLGLFETTSNSDPLGLFEESYGEKLQRENSEKTEKYKKNFLGSMEKELLFANPAEGLLGTLEQIPVGVQSLASTVAGGLGGAVGALIPGDTAKEGFQRSSSAVQDNTRWALPKSEMGQNITGMIGAAVEKWKEGAQDPNVIKTLASALPIPDYLANDPELQGVLSAGAYSFPELTMLTPVLSPKSPKSLSESKSSVVNKVLEKQAEIDRERASSEPLAVDPAISKEVARLHDQAILERLKEIDKERTARQRRGQAMFGEKVFSEEPTLNVDPQGQVFKGNVSEETSKLALERQGEALESALDSNTLKPPGQPLDLLQRDQLRASNEGPQANMLDVMQNQFKDVLEKQNKTILENELPPELRGQTLLRSGLTLKDAAESFKVLRETINPEVLREGFEKLKQLPDGTWLRAWGDGQALNIEAKKNGHQIGAVTFDPKFRGDTRALEAFSTKVREDYRRQGMASQMYKFAAELGNDVRPSDILSKEGKAMWEGFQKRGLTNEGIIQGKRDRSELYQEEYRQRALTGVKGSNDNYIPPNPPVKNIISAALSEGKDSKQWNYTESGSTLAAMKRSSALVLGVSRIVQNATKQADLFIRKNVFPVEKAFRSLTKNELSELSELLKHESVSGKKFDTEALENLNINQQKAYAHLREMLDDTLKIQNEARLAKGQKPITAKEAYLSHRWEGDFRRAVKNNDGKLVWYLAANTKQGLESQWKNLKKEFPELTYNPKEDHTVRYYKRETDLQSQYSTLLDILGRDDPAIDKIRQRIEEQSINETASFLGQEKHFKNQSGVRGFVGDRPGKSGFKESLDMIQQQIQYAKNAYRWSELQKAGQELKEIVSNPELNSQQPNNMKYVKEYIKNAIGYGEAKSVAHLEDSLRDLGFSPASIKQGVGNAKSFFILQKLGVSAGYTIANLLQTSNIIPHLTLLWSQGYKGNPLTSIAVGIPAGIAMATGHYLSFLRDGIKEGKISTPEARFMEKAFKYAEDNGVTARSIYDEAPINSSFSIPGRIGNAMGKTMAIPETFVRSMAFMSFVQWLKDSGKFKDDISLFQKAEEMVNASMVDYRAQERPMMFSKLGIAGDFLNTLQTYPMNWYNQWNLMGREALKGNVAPIAALIAVQYAIAGAMGIPGFDDVTKLYDWIKDKLPAKQYAQLQDSSFWSDPKLWMIENFGQSSVYGWLSDKSGIGLTSRVSAPGGGQMLQSPAGPLMDIGKQLSNLGQAVIDPSNTSKWAQVGMASVPPGLQGLLETSPQMEGKTFERRINPATGQEEKVYQRPGDIADHKGIYVRTPQEETLRKLGLRSQKETVEREVSYLTDKAIKVSREKANTIPDAFYDAIKRGDKKEASELYQVYVKLTGNGISNEQIENQIKENYMTSIERSSSAAKSVSSIQHIARMRKLLDQIRKENE